MYRKTNKLGSKIVEGQSQLLVTTTEHKTTHSRQAASRGAAQRRTMLTRLAICSAFLMGALSADEHL